MGKDALATLAPPDPTWNPPPTVPADSMVAAPGAMDMLAGRGVSDAPPPPAPADPNMITPGGASVPPPQYVPSETAPNNPDMERQHHESTWRRILDKVGSILGGDTTIHVTKDKDGNVSVTHDPSTSGEKWSRIAATALGGAAQGVANSRGPGGNFRAAAAGTQFGLQANQQREEDADKQATAEQKRQQLNASNVLTHQRILQNTMEADRNGLEINKESSDVLNKTLEDLKASPYAKDFGPVKNMDEVMRKSNENADYLRTHGNLQMKAVPVKGPNGWETHAIATDPGDDAQPVKKGATIHRIKVDPATGKSTLYSEPVSDMRMTNGALRVANSVVDSEFMKQSNDWTKANKPAAVKPPTLAELAWKAANSTDPAEQAAAKKAVDIYKEKAGTGTETEGNPLLPTTKGATNAELPDEGTFQSQFTSKPTPQGQAILDSLPTGQANLVQRFGNYLADESKELPRGKEREPFLNLVSSVYPNFDSAHYEARRDTVRSLEGDGKIAQSRNALNLAIQHMGEMYDAMVIVDPGEYPIVNKTSKTSHLTGGFGDKKVKSAYGSYADANEGVANEIARVFKGGAPNQTEINEYRGNADVTAPRSTQLGSFKTRSHMLASRMATINRQLQEAFGTPGKNYNLLTPEAVETLKKLPGGRAILKQAGYGAAAPAPAATAAPGGTPNNATAQPIPGATFDATIWHNVHPDKDLSAAIQKAKAQGMNVVNDPFEKR